MAPMPVGPFKTPMLMSTFSTGASVVSSEEASSEEGSASDAVVSGAVVVSSAFSVVAGADVSVEDAGVSVVASDVGVEVPQPANARTITAASSKAKSFFVCFIIPPLY